MQQPLLSAAGLLACIAPTAPTFANQLHQFILDGKPILSDIPTYVVAADHERPSKKYLEQPDLTDPLYVAYVWWGSLTMGADGKESLAELTHLPAAFRGYQWATDMLQHRSITSRIYYAVDDPDRVAFVRFVPEVAQSSIAFGPFTVDSCVYLTLCRYPDQTWRVWGLGEQMVSARDVQTEQ